MNTVSMSTPKWREYSIAVQIILIVIAGLVLWYSRPFIKMVGTLIQLEWVVVTGEWTDGGFQRGAPDMSNDPTKAADRWNIGWWLVKKLWVDPHHQVSQCQHADVP